MRLCQLISGQDTIAELLLEGLQCKVLLIIREEYIAYLSELEKVVPPLFDNRLRIEKMNDLNLARVIDGTCRFGGIQLVSPKETISNILNNLRNPREGIDLTNLQVYLDWLWRKDIERQEKQGQQKVEQITFDPGLVDLVGPIQNVLSDFLDEQLLLVEEGLKKRGVVQAEGLALELLFTLVTEEGTKRNLSLDAILSNMPRNRRLKRKQAEYCLKEFERIKLIRYFRDE